MSPVLRDSLTPCSCVTHETPSSPTNMRPTLSGCVTQETPSSPTKLIWCWKHLQSRRGTVKVTVLSLSSPAPPTSFCWALPFSAWREFTLEGTCPQGSKPKSLSQSMFHWTPVWNQKTMTWWPLQRTRPPCQRTAWYHVRFHKGHYFSYGIPWFPVTPTIKSIKPGRTLRTSKEPDVEMGTYNLNAWGA